MTGIDNLADVYAELRRMQDEIAKLGAANPLQSSSITTGRLRIGGSAILLVDSSGGLVVHGSINGDGSITWSGAFTLSGLTKLQGTTRFEGDTTQVGPLHVQGNVDLTGLLHAIGAWTMDGNGTINGDTGLYGNLVVQGGGRITVSGGVQMKIGQLASGIGGITWGVSYPSVYSDGAQVGMGTAPSSYLAASSSGPGMLRGSRAFSIDDSSHFMSNAATAALSANVAVDVNTGRLYRASSALRYKHNIRTVEHDPRLLRKVRVVLFDDIQTGTKNIAGVIGEVVAKNGGESFVRRGADGRVETVDYDRLALARTEILAKENDELRAENRALRSDMEALKAQVAELAATVSRSASEASAPSAD